MKKKFYLLVLFSIVLSFGSCEDEKLNHENINEVTFQDERYQMSLVLETDSKERVRNSVLELTELLKVMRPKYPLAFQELDVLLKSNFYIEPYLGLYELLEPDNSVIYKEINVNENIKGSFKIAFEKELAENIEKYPNLTEVSKRKRVRRIITNSKIIEKNFGFYDEAAIAFYAPYVKDLNDKEFNINNDLSIVPAVIDADKGIGYKENSHDVWDITSVDDDYAENNFTLIIQPINFRNPCNELFISAPINQEYKNEDGCYASGGDDGVGGSTNFGNQYSGICDNLEPSVTNRYIRQIFIGHAKINNKKQYDRLISFTGNGVAVR